MRLFGWLVLISLWLPTGARAVDRTDISRLFDFSDAAASALPAGWGGGSAPTIGIDKEIRHSGAFSLRLRRDQTSEGEFSSATLHIPVDFGGSTLILRGWLKTEDISEFAGLWLREGGAARRSVAFDNMADRGPRGTTDWQQFSVELPLSPAAKDLNFGVLAGGTGTVWADGLELLLDGDPIGTAPPREIPVTVLDTDRDFAGGSGVELANPTSLQVASLIRLGRVWGFLKYHHPAVVGGKYHWDFELFRILPAVLAAADQPAANRVLLDWVQSLGEVAACSECAQTYPDIDIAADRGWLGNTADLGKDLSRALTWVYQMRPVVTEQFFVTQYPNVGNPDFSRELSYENLDAPDVGYRLLALFRYWNIIEYWSPNREAMAEDWPAVLAEFVPRLVATATAEDYQTEMLRLIGRVHDSHANLWSHLQIRPPQGGYAVPVGVQFIDGEAVVLNVFDAGRGLVPDLRPGDVVRSIDGTGVSALVARWTPLYPASNQAARLRDMASELTGGDGEPCALVIDRGAREINLRVARQPRPGVRRHYRRTHDRPGPAMQLLTPQVAYLKMSNVSRDSVESYLAAAEGTRGWIIDLRNYPREFLVFDLGQHLVSEDTPFACFTVGDLENPGTFTFSSPLKLKPVAPLYRGKIVILVDEMTQSSAEYTAMAFRAAPEALVIGSTTAGADGNVSTIPLPGGLRTMISGIGVFTPDRQPTQRIGIKPDIEVRSTRKGIQAGRDEVLEKAFAIIMGRDPDAAERAVLLRSWE